MFTVRATRGTLEHNWEGPSYAVQEKPRRLVLDLSPTKLKDKPDPQLIMLEVADNLPAPYDKVEVFNSEGNKVGGYCLVVSTPQPKVTTKPKPTRQKTKRKTNAKSKP